MPAFGNLAGGPQYAPKAVNAMDPTSIALALQGITPDYNQGYHQSSFSGIGGSAGGGAPGSGGGGGFGSGFTLGGGGEQFGTSGQGAKIGALGGMGAAAVQNMGRQNRFNQAFGWLTGQGGGIGNAGLRPEVAISTGPIWNPQQIQAEKNLQGGQIDKSTATQQQLNQQRLSGSGMGGQSPLAQALSGQLFASGLGQKVAGGTNIDWQAAQGNRGMQMEGEKAQAQQRAQYNQALVGQLDAKARARSALMAAISGMV